MTRTNLDDDIIVSSSHLAKSEAWQLSEFEFGLIVAFNAFSRWTQRCMSAAGQSDLNQLDVLVLHNVNHRDKPKRLSDVAFILNVEDIHTVNYALKKLTKLGLLAGEKQGKEVFYSTTEMGKECCLEYRRVREQCLISALGMLRKDLDDFRDFSTILRTVSGIYDQASRSASSL